jgi:hypothetical protein
MQAILNKNPSLVKIQLKVDNLTQIETLCFKSQPLLEELAIFGTELLVL